MRGHEFATGRVLRTLPKVTGILTAMEAHEIRALLDRGWSMMESDAAVARQSFADALRATEQTYGADSEETIEPLLSLAKATNAISTQSGIEVESLLRRALATTDRVSAPAKTLEDILRTLALTCRRNGFPEEAIDHLKRVLGLVEARGGDPRFELTMLAHTLLGCSRPIEALGCAERVLALEKAWGVEDDDLLGPLIDVGLSLREAGRRGEALAVFRTAYALAIARKDIPELRAARLAANEEIRSWVEELEDEASGEIDEA